MQCRNLGDALLDATRLTLLSYAGTWNVGTFDAYAVHSLVASG
jgi:hypothetical protein